MRVLVVDDEPLVRRSLSRALASRGHEVRDAEDGPSGLEAWLAWRPDAVLIDVLMPGLSGPDVIRAALETKVESRPIMILMSAFTGEESVQAAMTCGADDFLAKPFPDIFEVVAKLEKLQQQRSTSGGQ
ncbi:MAG TPA: response regulator [Pseudobdellovibrionaceae bacterium]|nr:response regulator [Pseudobdellovibrionaceae bacterium]